MFIQGFIFKEKLARGLHFSSLDKVTTIRFKDNYIVKKRKNRMEE